MEPENPLCMERNDPVGRLYDDRRNHQQRPLRWGIGESLVQGAQDHASGKALHPGAVGGLETGVCRTESPGQVRPAEEALVLDNL